MASANEKPVYTTTNPYGVVAGATAVQTLPTRVASTGPVTYTTGGVAGAGALPVRVASTATVGSLGSASTASYTTGAVGGGAYAIPGATTIRTVPYGGSNPPSPNQVTYTAGASVSSNPPSPNQVTYASRPAVISNPPSPTLVQAPAAGSAFQYPTSTTAAPKVTYAVRGAGSSPPSGIYAIPPGASVKTVSYGAGAAGSNPPSPQRVETTASGSVYGAAAATVPAPTLAPATATAPAPAPAPAPATYRVVTPAEADFVAPLSARRDVAEVVAPETAAVPSTYRVYSGVEGTTQQMAATEILMQEGAVQQSAPFDAGYYAAGAGVTLGEEAGSAVTCPVDGEAVVYEVPSGRATAGDFGLTAAGGAGGLAYVEGVEADTLAGGRGVAGYETTSAGAPVGSYGLLASEGVGSTYEAVSLGAPGAGYGASSEISTETTQQVQEAQFLIEQRAYQPAEASTAAAVTGAEGFAAAGGVVEPVYGSADAGSGTSAYGVLSANTEAGIATGAAVVAGAAGVAEVMETKGAAGASELKAEDASPKVIVSHYNPDYTGDANVKVSPYTPEAVACWRFPLAIILHGLGAGAVAIGCSWLIDNVQAHAFGGEGGLLALATNAPVWRRMLCVTTAGLIGAFGWYFLRLYKTPFVQVETAMHAGKTMPFGVTCCNAFLQIVTVALGGSYGREAAPRELTAMVATHIADLVRVTPEQRMALVACGTGAGLAAVYSVPISGVFYICEHILKWQISKTVVVCAICTCLIGTYASSGYVTVIGLYQIPLYSYDWPSVLLVVMSAVVGVVTGAGAHCLRRLLVLCHTCKPGGRFPVTFEEAEAGTQVWLCGAEGEYKTTSMKATVLSKLPNQITVYFANDEYNPTHAVEALSEEEWAKRFPKGVGDWTILISMPFAFLFLAVLSAKMPFLVGNGRAMASTALSTGVSKEKDLDFLVTILLLKAFCTAAALGAGAAGGTLTPSCALGATMAGIVGWAWKRILLETGWNMAALPIDQIGIIGAASFLGVMMKAPISGVLLLWEFSAQTIRKEHLYAMFHGDFSGILKSKLCVGMLLPMGIAAALAMLTYKVLQPDEKKRIQKHVAHFQVPHDLDVRNDYHDYIGSYHRFTKDACLKCFHRALLVNGCFTSLIMGVAMSPDTEGNGDRVATYVEWGLLLGTVVGFVWFYCSRPKEPAGFTPPYLAISHDLQESLVTDKSVYPTKYSFNCFLALSCAFLGAAIPLIPWSCDLYKTEDGGDADGLGIAPGTTLLEIVIASAFAALVDVLNPHIGSIRLPETKQPHAAGPRLKAIAKFVLIRVLVVGLFFVVGRFCLARTFAKFVQ